MKRDIEAVIFDADGTILDTRELRVQAVRHVLSEHGYEMPPLDELKKYGGKTALETYGTFAPQHDSRELVQKHFNFQLTHLDLFEAYKGLHDLLATLKEHGLKIGMCTNRGANIIDLLDHLGIKEQFDGVVHFDLMTNEKPHPEGYLKLCEELGINPERTVMVGDTEADIGAGKAAGAAFTIGITHGSGSREMLEQEGADYVVDHLDEIVPLVTRHG